MSKVKSLVLLMFEIRILLILCVCVADVKLLSLKV